MIIKAEMAPGMSIVEAVLQASEFCTKTGVIVKFKFNEVECYVSGPLTVEKIASVWAYILEKNATFVWF